MSEGTKISSQITADLCNAVPDICFVEIDEQAKIKSGSFQIALAPVCGVPEQTSQQTITQFLQ